MYFAHRYSRGLLPGEPEMGRPLMGPIRCPMTCLFLAYKDMLQGK